MDPPTRVPLGDITNNITQGNQDIHGSRPEDADHSARKRQRERERFALMSTEKRNERNRKKRERRMQNKDRDNLNAQKAIQGEDGRLPVDEEDTDEWLHRGNWDENNRELHVGAINPDDVLNNGKGSFDDSRDDCFNSCTTPVVEGDVIQLDEGNDTQDISTGPNEDEDNFKCFVVLYMEMLHPHELLFVKSSIQVNNQSVHYHIGVFERRFLALFPSQGGTFRAQRVKEREDRCRLCDDDMLQLQWPGVDAWQIIGLLSGSLSRIWTNYLPFGEPWSIMWGFFLLRTKGNLKEITV